MRWRLWSSSFYEFNLNGSLAGRASPGNEGTPEYAVVDKSSFIFTRAGEGALTSCEKSDIFCEMDKGAVRLCDGRLELAEETFFKILSDC